MGEKKFTKNEILQAIKSLARRKERTWITCKEFVGDTKISMRHILKYFDKWNDAIEQAGLQPLDRKGRPDKDKGLSKEQLIEKMKHEARKAGTKHLKLQDFKKHTRISDRPIYRLFPGGWIQALKAAGLKPDPGYNIKIPDEALFDDYFKVVNDMQGRFPNYPQFARRSKYSIGVYEHRFGNFTEFRKHAIQHGIAKGWIKPEATQPSIENLRVNASPKEQSYKPLDDRPVLGEKIDFRGLLHAPVNEQGVVYLFGMLSRDLGFVVESVQSSFPDCKAKRRLKDNRWQRVRIEFEHKSSNFVLHKHDITKCDLIVCWEHDWKDCPLEVISLKNYTKTHK